MGLDKDMHDLMENEKSDCKEWFLLNHIVPNFYDIEDLMSILDEDIELLETHFGRFKEYVEEVLMDELSSKIGELWWDYKRKEILGK